MLEIQKSTRKNWYNDTDYSWFRVVNESDEESIFRGETNSYEIKNAVKMGGGLCIQGARMWETTKAENT